MGQSHSFRFSHNGQVVGRVGLVITCAGTPAALPAWVRAAIDVAWPALKPFQKTPWQLGLQVTTAAAAQNANRQFRNKDYVPDVLSFPLWEEGYAGDILLCWPTLKAAAKSQGKPLKAHVQHLVMHSLLHVAGYEHETPRQAQKMEALETQLLAVLGWPDPYIIA